MRGLLLAALMLAPAPAGPTSYDDRTTHVALTTRAIKLACRDGGYDELRTYKDQIKEGVIQEDSDPTLTRFVNHFFDPATGLGLTKNWYDMVFFDHRLPSFGDAVRYENALHWGRNNGLTSHYDWEGAIHAYGYSDAERRTAYEALGHVVHLVQDMAQPDHAKCRPHPGGYAHSEVAGSAATGDLTAGARKAVADYLFPENRIGYEALWKYKNAEWPEGKVVKKPARLSDYFVQMAEDSKRLEASLGLLGPGEKALGLRSYRSARADPGRRGPEAIGEIVTLATDAMLALWRLDQYRDFGDGLWLDFDLNAPIVPTIPWPPAAGTQPYIQLGNELLPLAEERSAGLMQLFHDIVNPPPYVQAVTIEQDGKRRYDAHWEDGGDPVTRRTLVRTPCEPIQLGRPAQVTVTFGPARKNLKNIHVWYEPEGARFEGPDPPAAWEAAGAGLQGQVWKGLFTPQTEGRFRIRAVDQETHLAGRDPEFMMLDSLPADPARVLSTQGYPWSGYQPGDDLNHTLSPDVRCVWCKPTLELLGTHWSAAWTGTIDYLEEHLLDGAVRSFEEHKVKVKFRSMANHEPFGNLVAMVVLTLGHAEGTDEIRLKRDSQGPTTTASRTPSMSGAVQLLLSEPGQDKHPCWAVFVPNPDQLDGGGLWRPFFREVEAPHLGRLSGRVSTLDGGGVAATRRTTEWRFTFTPAPAPPHVVQCDRVPATEADAINAYIVHYQDLLKPWYAGVRSPDDRDFKEQQEIFVRTVTAWGTDHTPAMSVLRDQVSKQYTEANALWLSEKPGNEDAEYAAKTEALKSSIDAWIAARRALEKMLADGTDRAAAIVERRGPDTAKKLREAAEKLRTKGSEAFGASTR